MAVPEDELFAMRASAERARLAAVNARSAAEVIRLTTNLMTGERYCAGSLAEAQAWEAVARIEVSVAMIHARILEVTGGVQ